MKNLTVKIAGIPIEVCFTEPAPEGAKKLYAGFLTGRGINPRYRLFYRGRYNRYKLNSLLRTGFSSALFKNKGFLLHASGIKKGRKALVFTGKSGAGKTTIAAILKKKGFGVLSDEIIAFRKSGGNWRAYGTPFMGEMKGGGKNLPTSGVAVFFLKKAKTDRISPVKAGEAYEKLLRNVIMFSPDSRASGLALDLVKNTECSLLEFKKTRSGLKGIL